jgi:hypothetical protein
MKTKLIFLVMLIFCFSCGTNNKPLSDAQKEKIKGEVKEVVNTYFKGAEEANADMIIGTYFDSPDFVFTYNGNSFSYKSCTDLVKAAFGTLKNQKITVVDEKYAVLDNSTVMVTVNNKCLMNYKDGHSVLQDPWISQILLKKIENKWKVISGAESGIEKNVASESSKGLNQAELLKKFAGNWEGPSGKETTQFIQFKNLQGNNVLSLNAKVVTKGKILFEQTGFWGYDAVNNNIDLSVIVSNGYVFNYIGEFTSPDKLELFDVSKASGNKFIFEFISRDEFKETTIENNKTSSRIVKRMK